LLADQKETRSVSLSATPSGASKPLYAW
jgi:hypothetical protein